MSPAGFWRRCAAWTLDAALVSLPVLAVAWPRMRAATAAVGGAFERLSALLAARMVEALSTTQPLPALAREWLQDAAIRDASAALQSALATLVLPPALAFAALFLAWCVAFERSPWQATPGKRALGLRVVDDAGGRLAAGHALLRFAAGALSWLTLNLGHAMAALPPGHRALHDIASGSRVVLAPGAQARMPAWARAWLGLLLITMVLANAWALAALAAAMRAALEGALYA